MVRGVPSRFRLSRRQLRWSRRCHRRGHRTGRTSTAGRYAAARHYRHGHPGRGMQHLVRRTSRRTPGKPRRTRTALAGRDGIGDPRPHRADARAVYGRRGIRLLLLPGGQPALSGARQRKGVLRAPHRARSGPSPQRIPGWHRHGDTGLPSGPQRPHDRCLHALGRRAAGDAAGCRVGDGGTRPRPRTAMR